MCTGEQIGHRPRPGNDHHVKKLKRPGGSLKLVGVRFFCETDSGFKKVMLSVSYFICRCGCEQNLSDLGFLGSSV